MEFFIPGMVLFLLFLFLAFYFIPKATPMIAAILSIIFLIYGVRDHFKRFSSEYRLSTWQEGLKFYSPAIMIFFIILFVIYSIMAFFTSGSVPVPSVPNIEVPTMEEINKNINNVINNTKNTIKNEFNLINTNKRNNNTLVGNITDNKANTNKKNNINQNGFRKSILETI